MYLTTNNRGKNDLNKGLFSSNWKKKKKVQRRQCGCATQSSDFGFHPQGCLKVTEWLPLPQPSHPCSGQEEELRGYWWAPDCLCSLCCLNCLSCQPGASILAAPIHRRRPLMHSVKGNRVDPFWKEKKNIKSRVLNLSFNTQVQQCCNNKKYFPSRC